MEAGLDFVAHGARYVLVRLCSAKTESVIVEEDAGKRSALAQAMQDAQSGGCPCWCRSIGRCKALNRKAAIGVPSVELGQLFGLPID